MSFTRVWAIGAVPDADVAALPGRFAHLEGEWTTPPGYAEDLAWWLGGGDREPYFTPAPTPEAHRFAAFARSGGPSAPAVAAMKEAAMDLLRDAEGEAAFAAAARKGDPAVALCYGLGAQAVARLPGWFGDFLLTAAEVRAVLPHAESVLAVTGPRRAEVIGRIDAWMSAMSDEPGFDARTLLDGPLRVLRYAAGHGTGAVGVTESY
ncbi:hypothetical protein FBY35_3078 [Streptomyces sp. SLBN-118]|uniref:hypothetical protein n=1 Tax=Streptomyces sp. SLBN-118 TaxID=2768454 RepID=UPI00114F8DFB|nr:hypothetical protein [Streptomyces sp. SLBN-118]TQK52635.1 hypothetical protein FBY35_3078 [Streptomyces sp. SLBN-118]